MAFAIFKPFSDFFFNQDGGPDLYTSYKQKT